MNAHALGVCVAPSFFVSCGDQTKVSLNDIGTYKVRKCAAELEGRGKLRNIMVVFVFFCVLQNASALITFIIEYYCEYDFFDSKHYDYYVNITGRPAKLVISDTLKKTNKGEVRL